ncbi:hypothetical protein GCM10010094_68060 [Streptomyces flaveus]|uniref:Uncharacterized protein n=1 Tax=Streptomyces flaveus TaxID=66370 RepID=A0A917RAN0_9ACTN|nr:hypothetical protein GCM10010094_68060 [Streptomyces flaveus]
MHKRMLRSALAAAFSAVVTLGAVGGLVGTQGDAPLGDSTWRVSAAATADDPSDSTWVSPVPAANPGDSTWISPASTGGDNDSTWVAES